MAPPWRQPAVAAGFSYSTGETSLSVWAHRAYEKQKASPVLGIYGFLITDEETLWFTTFLLHGTLTCDYITFGWWTPSTNCSGTAELIYTVKNQNHSALLIFFYFFQYWKDLKRQEKICNNISHLLNSEVCSFVTSISYICVFLELEKIGLIS